MLKQARLLITVLICFCGASLVSAYADAHEHDHQHTNDTCVFCELNEQATDDDAALTVELNQRMAYMPDAAEILGGTDFRATTLITFQSRGPPASIA